MDTDEFRTAYEPTSSDVPVKIEEHEVVVNDQTIQTGEDLDAKGIATGLLIRLGWDDKSSLVLLGERS